MKHLVIVLALAGAASGVLAQGSEADRAAKRTEIDFYTTKYIGDDIAYENIGCGRPHFPEVSKTRAEITTVSKHFDEWKACYDGYVQKLSGLLPAGKALPANVAAAMTPEELAQAKLRMAKVYDAVAEDANELAQQVLKENTLWMSRTTEFVKLEAARQKEAQAQVERAYRDMNNVSFPRNDEKH
jgi:hypothetical protein